MRVRVGTAGRVQCVTRAAGPLLPALRSCILGEAQIVDKATVLDAQTLPRVQMPNRDGFVPDPRPELFR